MKDTPPPLAHADHWGLGVRLIATLSALILGMAIGLAALGLFSTVRFFNGCPSPACWGSRRGR